MLIINDTLSTYGGSMDLLEQMCDWCIANDLAVMIICDSAENISLVERLEGNGVKIQVVQPFNYRGIGSLLNSVEEEVMVISFKYAEFISIEIAKKYTSKPIKSILYTIHKAAFDRGINSGKQLFCSFYNSIMIGVLEKYGRNGNVIMQDEINYGHMEESLQHVFGHGFPIIRQPYKKMYKRNCDEEELIKKGYCSNIIITAARAEFPFKGYIIGLLDDWHIIKEKYPDCILEIIADGEDNAILERKVAEVNKVFPSSVRLYGWMTIDELFGRISEAKLFIGVGTALLSAAEVERPAIPVQEGTMLCMTDGLFSDIITCVTSESCTKSAVTAVFKVLNMDYANYRQECVRTRETLSNYDLTISMRKFTEKRIRNTDSLLNTRERLFYSALNCLDKKRNNRGRKSLYLPESLR